MIVCVCNALRETQVRNAARDGAACGKRAFDALGCRPQCGSCLPFAHQLVREERNQAS